MELTLVVIFVLGYLAIAFEHQLKINKAAPALLIGVLTWTAWVAFGGETHLISENLSHHLSSTSEILFFLLGAMTIVEMVDAHQGFKVITNRIKTKDSRKLLWIISILTFFLSAVLDNLTTSIVMVSLLRRLVHDDKQRIFFASMVIVAANAGGAWSPIGDVTTTMLWIKGQISAVNIIETLLIPSLVCMAAPLLYLSFKMKGEVKRPEYDYNKAEQEEDVKGSKLMFFLGVGALLFVPVFKTLTHLPPYMGMLLGLAVIWAVSELIHIDKDEEEKKPYTAIHALSKIDTSSILFFLGILLAISSLESTHVLEKLATWMNDTIGNKDIIVVTIGLLSAVVDNVPLVAASQGMYPLASELVNPDAFNFAMANTNLIHDGIITFNGVEYFLKDAKLWEFIAYCAGTGGSCLIIGSAAGVAVMGMEKINFIWYMKRISVLALIGYFAGILCYIAIHPIFAVY
jgi:Na+/H+ antiporter NhaD/arsenite permease-like protein